MSDCISREAFKKKYLCCGYLPEMSEKEFDEFPAADVEPVRHWIPCSERMPENEGWYLTVVKPENASAFVNIYKFFAGTFHSFFQITHWMPLPEFREEDRRSDT